MRAEETPHEGIRTHRPLPSVDIPLLREERRASRQKSATLIVLAVLLVGGGVAAAVVAPMISRRDATGDERVAGADEASDGADGEPTLAAGESSGGAETGEAEGAESAESAEDAPAEPSPDGDLQPPVAPGGGGGAADDDSPTAPGAARRTTVAFGRARGFRPALANAGLSDAEAAKIERALTNVMDFRRCRPEDRMAIERNRDGELVLFEYHPGPTEYYRVRHDARGNPRGERVQVPVDRTRLVRGGRIASSLGDALEQVGLGRSVVGTFVSVFEGKINFSSHTRAGDTFRIIVDEERIDGQFLRYGTAHAVEYNGQRTGTVRAFWFETRPGDGDYYEESGRALHGGWLRAPTRYDRISSRFNPRRMHPILRRVVPHTGVDYAAGTGTPVWAAAEGTVTFAGPRGANGNLVSIRHANGYESMYAHLSRIERGIRTGLPVRQRQVIGYVGSTGRSTGPHLHFALKQGGRFVDPLVQLDGPGRMLPSSVLPRFRRQAARLLAELGRIDVGHVPVAAEEPGGGDDEHGHEDEVMD